MLQELQERAWAFGLVNMAEEDIGELKKLSVEERIRKLKEIEDKKKEEIKKAQDLLKNSEEELEEEGRKKRQIPIPQLKAVDVGSLFSGEEKEIFKTKRFETVKKEEALEDAVAAEGEKLTPKDVREQEQYRIQLSMEPTKELYSEIKSLYQGVEQKGYMNEQEKEKIDNIQYAMNKKVEDIESGAYNPSQYVAATLDKTQQLAEKLKSMYKGN